LPARSAPERVENEPKKGAVNGAFLLLKIPMGRTIVRDQLSDNQIMTPFNRQFEQLPAWDSRGLVLLSALLLLPLRG
jgi:hypothetical protein